MPVTSFFSGKHANAHLGHAKTSTMSKMAPCSPRSVLLLSRAHRALCREQGTTQDAVLHLSLTTVITSVKVQFGCIVLHLNRVKPKGLFE